MKFQLHLGQLLIVLVLITCTYFLIQELNTVRHSIDTQTMMMITGSLPGQGFFQ